MIAISLLIISFKSSTTLIICSIKIFPNETVILSFLFSAANSSKYILSLKVSFIIGEVSCRLLGVYLPKVWAEFCWFTFLICELRSFEDKCITLGVIWEIIMWGSCFLFSCWMSIRSLSSWDSVSISILYLHSGFLNGVKIFSLLYDSFSGF